MADSTFPSQWGERQARWRVVAVAWARPERVLHRCAALALGRPKPRIERRDRAWRRDFAVSLPLLDRFKTLHVVLFEPSAEVAGRLIRNLGNNPDLSGRAVVMNIALSNSAGLTRFFVSGESENSGVGGLVSSANRNPLPVWVQSLPGDGLVQDGTCAAPQLIKIDVEGFEIEVLKGLERTLRAHHPPVLFEHSVYRFKERQRPLDEVVTYLQSLGYSVYALESNQPIAADDLGRDADWIARAKV